MALGVTARGVGSLLWPAQDRELHGEYGVLPRFHRFPPSQTGGMAGRVAFAQACDVEATGFQFGAVEHLDRESSRGVAAKATDPQSSAVSEQATQWLRCCPRDSPSVQRARQPRREIGCPWLHYPRFVDDIPVASLDSKSLGQTDPNWLNSGESE